MEDDKMKKLEQLRIPSCRVEFHDRKAAMDYLRANPVGSCVELAIPDHIDRNGQCESFLGAFRNLGFPVSITWNSEYVRPGFGFIGKGRGLVPRNRTKATSIPTEICWRNFDRRIKLCSRHGDGIAIGRVMRVEASGFQAAVRVLDLKVHTPRWEEIDIFTTLGMAMMAVEKRIEEKEQDEK